MISSVTDCGIEFKTEIPILLKDSFIFTVLENLPEKHPLVSERFDNSLPLSAHTTQPFREKNTTRKNYYVAHTVSKIKYLNIALLDIVVQRCLSLLAGRAL